MTEVLRVELGERSYDILIGDSLLDQAGSLIKARKAVIVSDTNVAPLYAQRLVRSFEQSGVTASLITVQAGESAKTAPVLMQLCDDILSTKAERGDVVVALGGGVIGDLAGCAASLVRRGMRFVQIPTTLLAQVDSSVGGKTGINSVHGKNLIGTFYQPSLVIADTSLLDTLPDRELKAGYAEVIKYGLINDEPFFAWCEQHYNNVFAGPQRAYAVRTSCAAKAAIVARDEREEGERALLNLGHTFGHALERLAGYDANRLVHGEAVAIGLGLAFRFSQYLGLCPPDDAARVMRHLKTVGLPSRASECAGAFTPAALLEAMAQDKKVKNGALTFILAKGIGKSFIAPNIEAGLVERFLQEDLKEDLQEDRHV